MEENKQEICNLLLKALQATRSQSDLISLEYSQDEMLGVERVTAKYADGFTRRIDVTADSGIALIRDVAGRL